MFNAPVKIGVQSHYYYYELYTDTYEYENYCIIIV